ncbi:hypothetical protein AAKU52_000594 [Pedobacter sp. CG_S7]|uniref:hypothetical protein n=1 Tax=Pedobacter sp. CG_S7 TaxID=3143930 RepID=UPI0033919E47
MIIYELSAISLYGFNEDEIMKKITVAKGDGIGLENLYYIDGKAGFSLGQGQ